MENNRYHAIVIGAGPGGAAAAMNIAREGYRVLLVDKSRFPRDKSCGDGLTRMTAKLLYELGIYDQLSAFRKIKGVTVLVDGQGKRTFDYPEDLADPAFGLVVPRLQLDEVLCKNAVESGATLLENSAFAELLYDPSGLQVSGVKLTDGQSFYSDVVIAADGAASAIAYQSGLATTPKSKLGFGLRGYYSGITGLHEHLEISLPVLDTSQKHVLPSYGWVFPIGEGMANVGVGLIEKIDNVNIQKIMEAFVEKLQTSDPRFRHMKLEKRLAGAPMRFDFNPERSYAPGLMLVGDAAGMISPFTGEGIGYAIETGMIAAKTFVDVSRSEEKDFADLSRYGHILAEKFQGYFETGKVATSRFRLVWKVLKGTFQNEKPLFDALRQAALFPEGVGESFFNYFSEDVSECVPQYYAPLRTDMLAITENLINVTRHDWPFISRLLHASQITPGVPFRPVILLLLAGYQANTDRERLVKLGTSIELGHIASISLDSVQEQNEDLPGGTSNWGNKLSLLVGDFLLSKSYDMVSDRNDHHAELISKAMSLSAKGSVALRRPRQKHMVSFTVAEYLELLYMKNSASFELCMQLGALESMSGMGNANVLKHFGRYFGAAYEIIKEGMAGRQKAKRGSLSGPLQADDDQITLDEVIADTSGQADVLKAIFDIALGEMKKALECLYVVENLKVKESLTNLCAFIAGHTESAPVKSYA